MASLPKSRVRPVRIHLPPDDTGTVTVRGVGFRARCDCGWESRTTSSFAVARNASRTHSAYHTASPKASVSGPV